jgi:hypothetical protein
MLAAMEIRRSEECKLQRAGAPQGVLSTTHTTFTQWVESPSKRYEFL